MRGIYKITNKSNNKVYIGESVDIERRWKEHVQDLNNNNHHSYKLQKAWNQEGQNMFEFSVLEEIDQRIGYYIAIYYLVILEDKYIKEYNSFENGYNCEITLERVLVEERSITNNVKKDKRMIEIVKMKLESNMRLWKAEKAKIECIDTGIVYENVEFAAKDYGIKPEYIIRGKKIKGTIKVKLKENEWITFRYLNT